VVLEWAEALGEGDVLAAGDVLIADEQHLVLQQQRLELGEERLVPGGLSQADVAQLGSDRGGEWDDLDRAGSDGERREPVLFGRVDGGEHADLLCGGWWVVGVESGQVPGVSRAKTEDPTLRPDSRSRWAWTASSRAIPLVDLHGDAARCDVVEELARRARALRGSAM
jgi:hypothetical protein